MKPQRTVAIRMEMHMPFEWHRQPYSGILRYAKKHGWRCVIDEYPELTLPKRRRGELPYDGIVGRITPTLYASAKRLKIPMVNLWQASPVQACPRVHTDQTEIGRLAAEHLLSRGFQRFACLFPLLEQADSQIEEAFNDEVREAGYTVENFGYNDPMGALPEVAHHDWLNIQRWLGGLQTPLGMLATISEVVPQLMHTCQLRGWTIPYDLALMCIDNDRGICENTSPTLTSIDSNWEGVGYEAARLLDQLMDGNAAPIEPLRVPPRGLVPRGSTDYTAIDDPLVSEALRYIAKHLREPMDIEQVAAELVTSSRTLQRRFDQHLGRPFSDEVRRLRIELAKRLLADPDRQVGQVATEAGFSSSQRLNDVFQRALGMSPSAYRKRLR